MQEQKTLCSSNLFLSELLYHLALFPTNTVERTYERPNIFGQFQLTSSSVFSILVFYRKRVKQILRHFISPFIIEHLETSSCFDDCFT